MRKVTALSAFALVAAGAAAVGATTDPTSMKGSDTLFEIFANQTVDAGSVLGGLIRNCPGATGITYVGTGSGNGESQIIAHTSQRIAPMSRAVNSSGCNTDIGTSKGEGIVFALDGVAINVAGDFGAACNAPAGTQGSCAAGQLCVDTTGDSTGDICASGAAQCNPSADDCSAATGATGLAYSKTIAVQDLNGIPGVQCTPHQYAYGSNFNTPSATPIAAMTSKVIGCTAGANSTSYTIGGAGGAAADQNTAAFAWRDVLRILLLGMPNGTLKAIGNRDCNSDLRWTLANNYAQIFQTDCASNNCSQIKHVFRRDEFSGTTDVFLATLGMDGIDITKFDGTVFNDGTAYKNSRSFFCNVRRSEDTWLFPDDARVNKSGFPTQTKPFNPPYRRNETTGTAVNVYDTRPYFPEYQDADPIRRTCDDTNNGTGDPQQGSIGAPANLPTEQVCGARGTLGLVLPVSLPPGSTANNLRYPTDVCSKGKFVLRLGPVKDNGLCDYCPNGDRCLGGLCFFPVSASGVTACMNGQNNLPAVIDTGHAVNALPAPYVADGRVYNLYLHDGTTNQDDSLRVANRTNELVNGNVVPVQHVGAYYRIHQTRSLNTPADTTACQQNDDTQHIACLVNASKCSLGYTGREGPELQQGTMAAKVNNLEPTTACIQELLNNLSSGDFGNPANNYPMSRKLFVNTMVGFENTDATNGLSAGELALSKCTAAISDARVSAFGFIPLPNTQSNPVLRDPFCQDYDGSTCATPDTTDACTNNPAGIPSNSRVCKATAGTQGSCPTGQLCTDLNADGVGDVCQ